MQDAAAHVADSSSQFCLRKGLFHDNIDIMLSTEVADIEGEPGKFLVSLNRKSPLVDPTKCVSCGKCSEVCPVRVDSEFNAGLTKRAAIYLPLPHAIPQPLRARSGQLPALLEVP